MLENRVSPKRLGLFGRTLFTDIRPQTECRHNCFSRYAYTTDDTKGFYALNMTYQKSSSIKSYYKKAIITSDFYICFYCCLDKKNPLHFHKGDFNFFSFFLIVFSTTKVRLQNLEAIFFVFLKL